MSYDEELDCEIDGSTGGDLFAEDLLDEGTDSLSLKLLGTVDPVEVIAAIREISKRFLSTIEADLIYLMLESRRPVEISRILRVPECEVVRLRKNCFKKIRIVYQYDYKHDKAAFLAAVRPLLGLTPKQDRILEMFYDYYGLRQIAETIGTRPSNVHRSLRTMRAKIDAVLPPDSPHRVYLGAFQDFKYLGLALGYRSEDS